MSNSGNAWIIRSERAIALAVTLVIAAFHATNAFALMQIKKGEHELEGKLLYDGTGAMYFIVNHGTNSRVSLKLKGAPLAELKSQDGSNALLRFKLGSDLEGDRAEVDFGKVVRYLSPLETPKTYSQSHPKR